VTSRDHEKISLGGFERLLASYCDGATMVDRLPDLCKEALQHGDGRLTKEEIYAAQQGDIGKAVESNLEAFAKAALLVEDHS